MEMGVGSETEFRFLPPGRRPAMPVGRGGQAAGAYVHTTRLARLTFLPSAQVADD